MKIKVLLFAGIREAVGQDHIELELPAQSAVTDVQQQLIELFPESAELIRVSTFAAAERYLVGSEMLVDQQEVACIPPVSGG